MGAKFIEKRRYPRLKKKMVIFIVYKSEEGNIQTEERTVTEDLSAGGVKISLPQELPKDKLLDLQVFLFSDPLPLPAKGKVVWSQQKQGFEIELAAPSKGKVEETYWLGVEFIDIDPFTRERIVQLIKREFL